MNYSRTDYFARRKDFAIGILLSLIACLPFSLKACPSFFGIDHLPVMDTCPVIGAISPLDEVCLNEPFDIVVSGLSHFDSLQNGETDFGIELVAFTSTPTDPYVGGNSLGIISFENFENDSTALLADVVFDVGGLFNIYAILHPLPVETSCRPFVNDTLLVNYPPSALINITDPFCPGDTTGAIDLTIGGTGPFSFEWFSNEGTGLVEGLEDQANLSAGLFHVTITDASIAACQQDYTVFLNEEDNVPPAINCPGNITEYLGSGECSVILNFAVTATDNCTFFTGEPLISQIDSTGLSSGSTFPIGTTILKFEAIDGSGNMSNCSFQIKVIEYQNPSQSLFCNDGLSVALDQNCSAIIDAQDLLTGGPYGCFDDYETALYYDEDLTLPIITSPWVTSEEVGLTIYAKVTNLENNNSCSGSLSIQDNLIPALIGNNYDVLCTDDFLPGAPGIGFPLPEDVTVNPDYGNGPFVLTNFDACGETILTFSDEEEVGDCLNDNYLRRIIRTWLAEDNSGNTSTCTDTITVLQFSIDQVVIPPNRDDVSEPALSCSGDFELDNQGNPSPDETGWPSLNGLELVEDEDCGISAAYSDYLSDICDGTHDVFRTWTVVKWCPVTEIYTAIQIITVKDDQGPEIECPDDMTISTNQNDCNGSLILPEPVLSDLCSSTPPEYTVETTQGLLNGMILNDIPQGTTTVIYTATDVCGNESECSFTVTVEDQIPPVPVCEYALSISLSDVGTTFIPANVFDDGSFDNCNAVSFLVRRLDNPNCPGDDTTSFDTQVPFYCCDLFGENVVIELQVIDEAGNVNICQISVSINDNLNPEMDCPPDVVLDCQDDPFDLTLTGAATATDNCATSMTYTTEGTLNECNVGTLFRVWTAQDSSGNFASCSQQIDVIDSSSFGEDDINWPLDYSTNTCGNGLEPGDLPPLFSMPQYMDGPCDLIGLEHEDFYLPINDPGCISILRTWRVYNWCIYQPDNPNSGGLWEDTQLIEVVNSEAPLILSACDTMEFCSDDILCESGLVQLSIEATDDCTNDMDLNYNYAIDLNNDGNVDWSGDGFEISEFYPFGYHKIKWQVEDACGNISSCDQFFSIQDCQSPIVNLLNGITIEIGETTQIEVQAMAWDNPTSPTTDNCGISEWLIYAPSLGPGQSLPPGAADTSWVFDCDHLGTQTVDIWVSDINGNYSYVSTYVIVQDNDFPPDCPVSVFLTISGVIETEEADRIENVMMNLETNAPGIPDMEYSDVDGCYAYQELIPGGDYMILPELSSNPVNGVSTFDLVKMNQHILELDILDSPYKRIAADINQSGTVSTIDIVHLRKLILQIDTVFQNNTSWRFVDADFVFPNSENPWNTSFPEYFEALEIGDSLIADFIGIKIGDVNDSAETTGFDSSETDEIGSVINFKTKNIEFTKGEEINVRVSCDQFNNFLGFQYTCSFDQEVLDLVKIGDFNLENLNKDSFGYSFLEKGMITCSWYNAFGVSIESDQALFTLIFKAKSDGKLSRHFDFNSDKIKSEVYDDFSIKRVGLEFESEVTVLE